MRIEPLFNRRAGDKVYSHLLRNQPFTMYMHVQANGDPVKLAAVLHAALAESKTPLFGPEDALGNGSSDTQRRVERTLVRRTHMRS